MIEESGSSGDLSAASARVTLMRAHPLRSREWLGLHPELGLGT